jgi:hypothetical protein
MQTSENDSVSAADIVDMGKRAIGRYVIMAWINGIRALGALVFLTAIGIRALIRHHRNR